MAVGSWQGPGGASRKPTGRYKYLRWVGTDRLAADWGTLFGAKRTGDGRWEMRCIRSAGGGTGRTRGLTSGVFGGVVLFRFRRLEGVRHPLNGAPKTKFSGSGSVKRRDQLVYFSLSLPILAG